MSALKYREPKYRRNIAILVNGKRGRVFNRKWSKVSGWWYEARWPDSNLAFAVQEDDVVPTED